MRLMAILLASVMVMACGSDESSADDCLEGPEGQCCKIECDESCDGDECWNTCEVACPVAK